MAPCNYIYGLFRITSSVVLCICGLLSVRVCVCVCVCVRARAERVGVCAWEGGSAEAVNACVAQLRVSQRASWALSNVQIFTLTFPIHDVAQTKIHTFVTCTAALP